MENFELFSEKDQDVEATEPLDQSEQSVAQEEATSTDGFITLQETKAPKPSEKPSEVDEIKFSKRGRKIIPTRHLQDYVS